MRIDIPFIDLENQQPTRTKYCYLLLEDFYLQYKYDFYANEPKIEDDWNSGTEEYYNCYDNHILKKHIVGIDMFLIKRIKIWRVTICINSTGDIPIYFTEKADARKVYDQIKEWLFGKT